MANQVPGWSSVVIPVAAAGGEIWQSRLLFLVEFVRKFIFC